MEKLTLKYAGTSTTEDFAHLKNPQEQNNVLYDSYWLCNEDGMPIIRPQSSIDRIADWLKEHEEVRAQLRVKLGVSDLFFRIAAAKRSLFCIRFVTGMPRNKSDLVELYPGDVL